MQSNWLQNNPLIFWVGLVLMFLGLVAAFLYLVGPHIAMFGPGIRVKHGLAALVIAIGGAALASFARPRGPVTSDQPRYNR
jgi:hypothetical protein